jgi:hypothetical protein
MASFQTCFKRSRFVAPLTTGVTALTHRLQTELVLDVRFAQLAEGRKVWMGPTKTIER